MKINPKSQKGAITMIVLVAMLFLIAILMSLYLTIANKAKTSVETTDEISKKYDNLDQANAMYDSYFADNEIVPIYTKEQLQKIASGEQIEINGKIYTYVPNAIYAIQNDIDLGGYNETSKIWVPENAWTPLTDSFTGILDGLGHKITGLYINDETATNQGLFGTLKGTVKNLSIEDSYIKAKDYVGSIAGKNEGTIEKCYNTSPIIGETNVTGGYFKSIETGEQVDVWNDNVLEANTYFVSGANTATAPKGFKVSKNVLEQTIEDGMVIQDAEGNEFVWVPVIYKSTGVKNENGYDTGFFEIFKRQTFTSSTLSSNNIEPFINGYTNKDGTTETEDYNKMLKSVYENEGFYIGRYEAGSTTARSNMANGTTEMVVKRDSYPYFYVGWGNTINNYTDDVIDESGRNQGKGALLLSKELYGKDENIGKYGVESTLCYGIQWDAMLSFIKDDNHSVIDSTSWGNYKNNTWIVDRKTAKISIDYGNSWQLITAKKEKNISETAILTTGATETFRTKNIYDVAGNVLEWTNETINLLYRNSRGGYFLNDGSSSGSSASHRNAGYPNGCGFAIGFRPVLYIKTENTPENL